MEKATIEKKVKLNKDAIIDTLGEFCGYFLIFYAASMLLYYVGSFISILLYRGMLL